MIRGWKHSTVQACTDGHTQASIRRRGSQRKRRDERNSSNGGENRNTGWNSSCRHHSTDASAIPACVGVESGTTLQTILELLMRDSVASPLGLFSVFPVALLVFPARPLVLSAGLPVTSAGLQIISRGLSAFTSRLSTFHAEVLPFVLRSSDSGHAP